MSSDAVVIATEGVTKSFQVRESRDAGASRWSRNPPRRFVAVDDVSIELRRGEVVGLVGANGAGKSTLLKLISRVMHPERGTIALAGPVMSLLEVGAGFHPDLTARENVYLNGAILGLPTRAVSRHFDQIIELAGVERFVETQVKRFSSGMKVRLAIAVALHLESDAMILDEVLAVGDADFQRRCLEILSRMVEHEGRAAFLVSHNMQTIREASDRVIAMSGGKVLFDGDPERAIHLYFSEVAQTGATDSNLSARTNPLGSNRLHIQRVQLVDEHGEALKPVVEGPLGIELSLDLLDAKPPVKATLSVATRTGTELARVQGFLEPELGRQHQLNARWWMEHMPLGPGQYTVSIALRDGDGAALDAVEQALTFTVTDPASIESGLSAKLATGFVNLDGVWLTGTS